jgi:hypothetical protein
VEVEKTMSIEISEALSKAIGAKRYEDLRFEVELNAEQCDRHLESVKTVLAVRDLPFNVQECDTLKVTYNLSIGYWGDVVQRLTALLAILDDPAAIGCINTKELVHGQCLIQSVFEKLGEVQRKIANDP